MIPLRLRADFPPTVQQMQLAPSAQVYLGRGKIEMTKLPGSSDKDERKTDLVKRSTYFIAHTLVILQQSDIFEDFISF